MCLFKATCITPYNTVGRSKSINCGLQDIVKVINYLTPYVAQASYAISQALM